MRIDRVGAGLVVVAGMLAVSPAFAQERSAPSPACRELARRVDLIAADAGSLELNAALFRAADAGCVPVARRVTASAPCRWRTPRAPDIRRWSSCSLRKARRSTPAIWSARPRFLLRPR